jgi:hypothetical protein
MSQKNKLTKNQLTSSSNQPILEDGLMEEEFERWTEQFVRMKIANRLDSNKWYDLLNSSLTNLLDPLIWEEENDD